MLIVQDAAERTWQVYLALRPEPAYGLWALVAVNAIVFVIFAFSFGRPRTALEWRSFGALSAFVVALFVEMYGFPLTLFVLSGWLQSKYPEIDLLAHDAGHLWQTIFGLQGPAHATMIHVASNALIAAGLALIVLSWRALRAAQRAGRVAAQGPYAFVRHPQYLGFLMIIVALLLQWPTFLTLAMFPVLVWMYLRLARQEELDMQVRFGDAYVSSVAGKPRFVPFLGRVVAVQMKRTTER
ncbi:MAG: isoprenylcysteine carboxylmethyltransferase family protein [Betaproteobacteria bacterium]|nr:isoprenylcysteine carboxylmethyltransferase family protein [Betaproteobacteria bacterium]MDH5578098.1 isoprenylcysteine carboxylmethyltransferase family protein [Betaproteobacteria bacterium]